MQITIRELCADDIALAAQVDRTETVHAKYVARYQNDRRTITMSKLDLDEPMKIPGWRAEHFVARLASWKEQIADGGALIGAFDGEQVVGFIILKKAEQDGSAQISAVFVNAQHRRLGIGGQMMRRIESIARMRGVKTLWLSSNETASAVEFYFKQGFSLLALCDNTLAPHRSGDPLFAKALDGVTRSRATIPATIRAVESTLASGALADLVRDRYDISILVRCTFIKRGTNDTYLIESGSGPRAVLRVYPHAWRTRDEIEEELQVLDHLHLKGVKVAHAIPASDDELIQTIAAPEGERHLVLFTYAEGDVGPFDDAHLFALGENLAEIHQASNDLIDLRHRPTLDTRHLVLNAISHYLAPSLHWGEGRGEGPAVVENRTGQHVARNSPLSPTLSPVGRESECAYLREVVEKVEQSLSKLPGTAPAFGLCHGDFGGFNTHVDSTGHQTHFDFDFCGFGHRAYDLAVFLWSRHKIVGPRRAPKHFERFVEGYESVRKLTDHERHAIPYLVLCREIFMLGVALQSLNRFPRRPSEYPVAGCVDFVKRWIDDHKLDC